MEVVRIIKDYDAEYPESAALIRDIAKRCNIKTSYCKKCRVLYLLNGGYREEGMCCVCSGSIARYKKNNDGKYERVPWDE